MKKLTFLFLIILLPMMASAQIQSQDNLVDRVSRAVGVRLPDGYEAKVKEFTNKVLIDEDAADFTEKWIAGQMKTSWGIDRGNQLLFVWDAVYEQITKKNFYDGEDGNKKRIDEFEKVIDNVKACGKKFKEDFIAHMKQQLILITYHGLEQCIRFYQLYKKNPSPVMPDDLSQMKNSAIEIIQDCKKYNIDYKAELRKELGDDKKVAELLKFYGIE